MEKIIVIGASGQIGSELTMALRQKYGHDNVIASDIRDASEEVMRSGPFEILDVMNETHMSEVIKKNGVQKVYLFNNEIIRLT